MPEEKKPVEATIPLPPGTVVDSGKPSARKIPWTLKDMEKYPKRVFTPEETVPVTVHGLKYQLIADQEITVPSIVYDIYMEHRKSMRDQRNIIYTPMGPVSKSPGAGALEPEAIKQT